MLRCQVSSQNFIKLEINIYNKLTHFLLGMIEAENITWALEQPYIEDIEQVCVQIRLNDTEDGQTQYYIQNCNQTDTVICQKC